MGAWRVVNLSQHRRARSPTNSKLVVDVLQMLLHSPGADAEGRSDFAIRLAVPDERENIALARIERPDAADRIQLALYLEQIGTD